MHLFSDKQITLYHLHIIMAVDHVKSNIVIDTLVLQGQTLVHQRCAIYKM